MDINRQNMNELFLGFQQIFKRGFEAADLEYRKFSTEVRSTTAVEVYPFLEQFGGVDRRPPAQKCFQSEKEGRKPRFRRQRDCQEKRY